MKNNDDNNQDISPVLDSTSKADDLIGETNNDGRVGITTQDEPVKEIPPENYSEDLNKKKFIQNTNNGRSDNREDLNEDSTQSQDLNLDQNQDEPYNEGESSVSGSAPYVTSDDDTLQNAHNVGMQLGDTDDGDGKREELDIARDVDKAEEDLRTH